MQDIRHRWFARNHQRSSFVALRVAKLFVRASFCFCFHYTGDHPNEYHFPPSKARPPVTAAKVFCGGEAREGDARRREKLSVSPGHALLMSCHAMLCAPKDWIVWITPRLSALRQACCNASSKTKQPTPVPNIGNRCRGRGRQTPSSSPSFLQTFHWLLHARTDPGRRRSRSCVCVQRGLAS